MLKLSLLSLLVSSGLCVRCTARLSSTPRASIDADARALIPPAAASAFSFSRARVSHILVASEDLALTIAESLEQGASWGETARSLSTCDSAANDGHLGWITPGMYVPEFDAVAFNSAEGETVVADSPFGWHIIRVHEASTLPLAMAPEELKQRLQAGAEPLQMVDIRDEDELE